MVGKSHVHLVFSLLDQSKHKLLFSHQTCKMASALLLFYSLMIVNLELLGPLDFLGLLPPE